MSSLRQALQMKRTAQPLVSAAPKDPESEAKLDRFIAAHPNLHAHYQNLDKEVLVRNQMRTSMAQGEQSETWNEGMRNWENRLAARNMTRHDTVQNVDATNKESASASVEAKPVNSVRQISIRP